MKLMTLVLILQDQIDEFIALPDDINDKIHQEDLAKEKEEVAEIVEGFENVVIEGNLLNLQNVYSEAPANTSSHTNITETNNNDNRLSGRIYVRSEVQNAKIGILS